MFSQQIADEICKRLAAGETLRQICETEGYPDNSTVVNWAAGLFDAPASFAKQYARARSEGLDVMADEIIKIADSAEWESEKTGSAAVQAARLQVDARKWLLSKMRPDKYGDLTKLEHSGPGGKQLQINVTRIDQKPEK